MPRPPFRLCMLLVCSIVLHNLTFANETNRRPAGSPNDAIYTKGRTNFSVETGFLFLHTPNPFTFWTKSYKKNPLPYKAVPVVLTWHKQACDVEGDDFRRGNWEYQVSAVYSQLVDGPEHRWVGALAGLRYNFVPKHSRRVAPFVTWKGGVGAIDASGVKYGQEKDLTFSFLIGIGVRINLDEHSFVTVQCLTQHISNGWQTSPSEGVDMTGPSIGVSIRF